jgi:hypothetical protein
MPIYQPPKPGKPTIPPYRPRDHSADQVDAMRAALEAMDLNNAAMGAITAADPTIDQTVGRN